MDIQITGRAQWDAWQAGVLPPVEQLTPWLWSIPVPIPNSPLRHLNAYAIKADDGIVLIDTGWPDESALGALQAGLTQIGSHLSEVSGVLITHAHPDHYGLVASVREASGAWVAMHEKDLVMIAAKDSGVDVRQSQVEYLIGIGASRSDAELSAGRGEDWDKFVSMPAPDRTFNDQDLVVPERGVRALWTPGHSPGHTCFLFETESLLVSGDHLLPRITPNITARAVGTDVPLAQYLDSLAVVRALDVAEVLPGHEYRFAGHRDRIDSLVGHHHERLNEVMTALEHSPGISTWDLSTQLTWSRPWEQMHPNQWGFAVGETLSHLDLLRHRGLADASGESGHMWSFAGSRAR